MADQNKQAGQSRGNRPADNARQATPASLLGQTNWQGSGGAEDFLGLNEEPAAAPQVAASAPAPVAVKTAQPLKSQVGDESWLMDDVQVEVEVAIEAPLAEPEAEEYEEPRREADALSAPAVLDASWTEAREEQRSKKLPLLAAAAGVIVLGAAAFYFMKPVQHGGAPSKPGLEIAKAPLSIDSAAKTPVDSSPKKLEPPKSTRPASIAASDSGVGRRAVDRSGNTEPTPTTVSTPAERAPDSNSHVSAPEIAFKPKAPEAIVAAPKPQVAPKTTKSKPVAAKPEVPQAETPQPVAAKPEVSKPEVAKVETPNQGTGLTSAVSGPIPIEVAVTPRAKIQPTITPTQVPVESAAPATVRTPALDTAKPLVAIATPTAGTVQPSVPVALPPDASAPVAALVTKPEAASIPDPSVRVLTTTTLPIADASAERPKVDAHLTGVPTDVATNPASDDSSAVHPPSVSTRGGSIQAEDVLLAPAALPGVRLAQNEDMLTVWKGETVPLDRIESKFKVMTPNVGMVRVTLKSKDVFEGLLYAVGENSVWLEGPFGRMGLDNPRIASVEKLAPDPRAAVAKGAKAPVSDRVRVATPGGQVFGRFISTDGITTKIVTDAGLKLVVDSKAVEFVEQVPKIVIKQDAPHN